MNAELLVNVIKDCLIDGKDLEIVKNLWKEDRYTRLKWKNAKDIFSGQAITGLDLPDGRIVISSDYPLTASEIEKMLKSNGLCYKVLESGNTYRHFYINQEKLKINYLLLYKDAAKKFINYFKLLDKEEKKDVLKEVLDCEFTNEKVTEWLSEHETDLLREISFND